MEQKRYFNFKQKNSQQKLTARFSKGEQGESNLIGCLQN
ncbi:hypothetical protein B4117_5675 [Bacillus mycoides]|nr:hypothetical protein B4117_5675 [Bacillus mycoides]